MLLYILLSFKVSKPQTVHVSQADLTPSLFLHIMIEWDSCLESISARQLKYEGHTRRQARFKYAMRIPRRIGWTIGSSLSLATTRSAEASCTISRSVLLSPDQLLPTKALVAVAQLLPNRALCSAKATMALTDGFTRTDDLKSSL